MEPRPHPEDMPTMGKTQKTIILNDDLSRLVQASADKIGASFQRIVQTALLEFFFNSTTGPDKAWVAASVSLEKGKVQLVDVPIQVFEDYAKELERKIALQKEKGIGTQSWRDWAERQIRAAYSDAGVWRSGISLYGGDVDALIDFATTDITERDHERFIAPPDTDDAKENQ